MFNSCLRLIKHDILSLAGLRHTNNPSLHPFGNQIKLYIHLYINYKGFTGVGAGVFKG